MAHPKSIYMYKQLARTRPWNLQAKLRLYFNISMDAGNQFPIKNPLVLHVCHISQPIQLLLRERQRVPRMNNEAPERNSPPQDGRVGPGDRNIFVPYLDGAMLQYLGGVVAASKSKQMPRRPGTARCRAQWSDMSFGPIRSDQKHRRGNAPSHRIRLCHTVLSQAIASRRRPRPPENWQCAV